MRINWFISPLKDFLSAFKRQPLFKEYGHERRVQSLTEDLVNESNETNQRTGMRLFCALPGDAANAIVNGSIDPYYISMSKRELHHWINVHLFFDEDGEIVAVHDYGHLIWKKPGYKLERK